MELSIAKMDEEAELLATEKHMYIRQCLTCRRLKNLRFNCPLRRSSQASLSENVVNIQQSGMERENVGS